MTDIGNAIIREHDLEEKPLWCSKCDDNFWNHKDCDSLREYGICSNCYKKIDLL